MLLGDKTQSSYSSFVLSTRFWLFFQVFESKAFVFMLEKIFLVHEVFFVFTVFLLPQHLIKALQCSLYRKPDQNSIISRIVCWFVKDLSSNSFSA